MKKQKRECKPCTGCCDGWVQIVVDNVEVYPGSPCPYSTGQGCSNYDGRPEIPCRTFYCGWILDDSPLPDWMRPDLAKVIYLPNQWHWHDFPVDLAVPVGKRISPRAMNWIEPFVRQQRLLVYLEQEKGKPLSKDQQVIAVGPEEFQLTISELMQSGDLFSIKGDLASQM